MNKMRPLRNALILLVLCAIAGVAAAQDSFPKGEIVDPVVCKDHPDQSYALYLPTSYTTEKKFPILYCFDPAARGKVPVELYKEAAERLGYIVVGSNNSRNGPWEPVLKAIAVILSDTQARLAVDSGRAYSTGMSGGGSPAWNVAVAGAVGTIICASAMEFTEAQLQPVAFDVFNVAGIADFNYEYLRTHFGQLLKLGKGARFETFDGGHAWPPKELAGIALDWMELQAIRRGLRSKDEAFIEELFRKERKRATELEAARKPLQALRLYEALTRDFGGLHDVAACRSKVTELSASKEIKDALKWEDTVADGHHQRMDKLIMARTTLENPPAPSFAQRGDFEESRADAAEIDARRLVSSMRGQMEKPFSDRERVISQRVLENFYIDTIFRAGDQMSRKDYRAAISNYRLCSEVRPTAVAPLLELARGYAGLKDRKRAVQHLAKAIDAGLKDAQAVNRSPEFQNLRGDERFEQQMRRLAAD